MRWASATELSDLNFMVPDDDPSVVALLQQFMEKGKICDPELPFHRLLEQLREKAVEAGLKDVDIIQKFCKLAHPVTSAKLFDSCQEREPEVPQLVYKLVEVEYMMRDQMEVPHGVVQNLYAKFRQEQPAAATAAFKEFLTRQELS